MEEKLTKKKSKAKRSRNFSDGEGKLSIIVLLQIYGNNYNRKKKTGNCSSRKKNPYGEKFTNNSTEIDI